MIEANIKIVLDKAIEAASRKDIVSFMQHIHDSRFLDGAKRTLEHRWGLDKEAIHEILSDSVDRLYEAAQLKGIILFPGGYFFKIIERRTVDYYRSHANHEGFDDTREDHTVTTEQEGKKRISADPEEEHDERIKEGIRIARSLLPKIGEENVQKVMSYIINAVEAGVVDISNREIAEAISLSEVSVRKWKQRGFERLKRAAIKEGYRKEFFRDITPTDNDEEEKDEE